MALAAVWLEVRKREKGVKRLGQDKICTTEVHENSTTSWFLPQRVTLLLLPD